VLYINVAWRETMVRLWNVAVVNPNTIIHRRSIVLEQLRQLQRVPARLLHTGSP
jgi:hypothetical protein